MIKRQYLDCACSTLDHTFAVNVDTSDDHLPLWIDFHLCMWRPWYKRIWLAIKYIFGYQSKFGHYDTVCLDREQAYKLVDIINEAYPV